MAAPRPQPRFPEPDTQPFWEATKRHELTYQTCNTCNAVIFYPRSHCTQCGSRDLTRRVSQGCGVVYTFTYHAESSSCLCRTGSLRCRLRGFWMRVSAS